MQLSETPAQRGIHRMPDVNALMTCLIDLARTVRDLPQTPATAAVRDNLLALIAELERHGRIQPGTWNI
jgi:hypothetical protein